MRETEAGQPRVAILAHDVAAKLGSAWSAEYECLYGWKQLGIVKRSDGPSFTLQENNGRITVSGKYPGSPYYTRRAKDITVSADRGCSVLAAEIQRRFLGLYLDDYARIAFMVGRARDAEEARERVIADFALIAGSGAKAHSSGLSLYLNYGAYYGTVAVISDQVVNFDLHSVPVSLTKQILALLAAQDSKHEGG